MIVSGMSVGIGGLVRLKAYWKPILQKEQRGRTIYSTFTSHPCMADLCSAKKKSNTKSGCTMPAQWKKWVGHWPTRFRRHWERRVNDASEIVKD